MHIAIDQASGLELVTLASPDHKECVLGFSLEAGSTFITVNATRLYLAPLEMNVLQLLLRTENLEYVVRTKQMFFKHLYGLGNESDWPEQKIIDVVVCKIRKKIEKLADGNFLPQVWGRGWMLLKPGRTTYSLPKRGDRPAAIRDSKGELVLTLANLPTMDSRWVVSRKNDVILAIQDNLLTFEEACSLYRLTYAEYQEWHTAFLKHGRDGLRTTQTLRYI